MKVKATSQDDAKSQTQARYERMWRVVAAIPQGCVASYGQVAELAGVARGARQVGRALSSAPRDMKLPWHRVINAAGKIALPIGSSGYRRQRRRLIDEGVVVNAGRVNMKRYQWQPDLDEILWRI